MVFLKSRTYAEVSSRDIHKWHHADFWKVTQDALDFAFDMHGIKNPDLHRDLMEAYLKLDCYPEVPEALSILKSLGFRVVILSDGTPAMLDAAVTNSGIGDLIEKNFSAEDVGIFKPDSRVYRIAVDGLKVRPEEGDVRADMHHR